MSKKFVKTFWNFVKVGLLVFAIFIAFNTLITLILYHDVPAGQRGTFTEVSWFLNIILFISYFIIYSININNEAVIVHEKPKFDFKTEVLAFFTEEKTQFWLLTAIAVIYEIIDLMIPPTTPNPIMFCLSMIIPTASAIEVPILGTVVAYVISLAIMVFTTVLIKYIKYRNWNKR